MMSGRCKQPSAKPPCDPIVGGWPGRGSLLRRVRRGGLDLGSRAASRANRTDIKPASWAWAATAMTVVAGEAGEATAAAGKLRRLWRLNLPGRVARPVSRPGDVEAEARHGRLESRLAASSDRMAKQGKSSSRRNLEPGGAALGNQRWPAWPSCGLGGRGP